MSKTIVKTSMQSSTLLRGIAVAGLSLSLGLGAISAPHAHASSLSTHVAGPGKGEDCEKHPSNPGCVTIPPDPTATPELGSGELLATGLLPIGAVLFYRRRRARRTQQ